MAEVAEQEVNGPAGAMLVPTYEVQQIQKPEALVQEQREAAREIRKLIPENDWAVSIGDREHLRVEAWITLGHFRGYTPRIDPKSVVEEGERGARSYRVYCEVIHQGAVIAGAFGSCGTDEPRWTERPCYEYRNGERVCVGMEPVSDQQRLSMATTRAQSKALGSVLRAIAVMAGYAPTPAEEMDSVVPPANDRQRPESRPSGARPSPGSTPPKPTGEMISAKQWGRLWAIYKKSGKSKKELAAIVKCPESEVYVRSKQIPASNYDATIQQIEGGK